MLKQENLPNLVKKERIFSSNEEYSDLSILFNSEEVIN